MIKVRCKLQVVLICLQWRLMTFGLGSAAEPKSKYIQGVTEKSEFILTGNLQN
jgi:hypothetical protein